MLTCPNSFSGQAKPNKKVKVTKPAEDPKVAEPDQQDFAPEASEQQLEDPASNTQTEMPELFVDQTNIDPSTTEPSSSLNPPETYADDILITGTGFTEPGNPTILANILPSKKSSRDGK